MGGKGGSGELLRLSPSSPLSSCDSSISMSDMGFGVTSPIVTSASDMMTNSS